MKIIVEVVGVVGSVVLALVLVVVLAFLFAYPAMWLVNYLFAPTILIVVLGTPVIGFWKAFWLNVFFGIVFKLSFSSPKN